MGSLDAARADAHGGLAMPALPVNTERVMRGDIGWEGSNMIFTRCAGRAILRRLLSIWFLLPKRETPE
jgi:hypothetical protein